MILIKLKRDQARCIEESFFPYIVQVAEMKLRNSKIDTDEYLNCKIVLTLIYEVQKIFARKLASDANKFNFKFTDAQGITLYKFLMKYPMQPIESWAGQLRQDVCTIMHKQVFK